MRLVSDLLLGIKNCALCGEYWTEDGCDGCPVKDFTGENYCVDTPYYDVSNGTTAVWGVDHAVTEHLRQEIQKEVDFLEMIRDRYYSEERE